MDGTSEETDHSNSRYHHNHARIFVWFLFIGMGIILLMFIQQSPTRIANGLNGENKKDKTETIASEVAKASGIPSLVQEQDDLAPVIFESEDPIANVLIVRGVLTVFSLGMNELGKELIERGYSVSVVPAIQANSEAIKIRNRLAKSESPKPLVIMGHSLGGDLAPKMAAMFGEQDIQVDLLIMLDSTMPSSPP
ncbi:MAG: thioesterase domain-containing protein, partial [Planctomycetota bacterium]